MTLSDRILSGNRLKLQRMWMNMWTYASLRKNSVNLLELELQVEVLRQGILGTFLGVEVRASNKIRTGDIFLASLSDNADLSPSWAPYAEEDAQRVSRYERAMDED